MYRSLAIGETAEAINRGPCELSWPSSYLSLPFLHGNDFVRERIPSPSTPSIYRLSSVTIKSGRASLPVSSKRRRPISTKDIPGTNVPRKSNTEINRTISNRINLLARCCNVFLKFVTCIANAFRLRFIRVFRNPITLHAIRFD